MKKVIVCPDCPNKVEMDKVKMKKGGYRGGCVRDEVYECPNCGVVEELSVNMKNRQVTKVRNIKRPTTTV
jgi:uncharacterized Zn finger protein